MNPELRYWLRPMRLISWTAGMCIIEALRLFAYGKWGLTINHYAFLGHAYYYLEPFSWITGYLAYDSIIRARRSSLVQDLKLTPTPARTLFWNHFSPLCGTLIVMGITSTVTSASLAYNNFFYVSRTFLLALTLGDRILSAIIAIPIIWGVLALVPRSGALSAAILSVIAILLINRQLGYIVMLNSTGLSWERILALALLSRAAVWLSLGLVFGTIAARRFKRLI